MAIRDDNAQVIVDDRFYIPTGIIDVRNAGASDGSDYYGPKDVAVQGPILNTPSANIPMPPTSYSIVEQHVRISSDGRAVVDVYLEFPDVPGVNSVDVRVTKA
jgi:hypothetical protein